MLPSLAPENREHVDVHEKMAGGLSGLDCNNAETLRKAKVRQMVCTLKKVQSIYIHILTAAE